MLSAHRIHLVWPSLPRSTSWVGTAMLFFLFVAPVWCQNPTQDAIPPAAASGSLTPKERREAKIAADVEKLYQMALDLKVEVDKSNKDTVSLSVAKRAAELEKLAKTVKQEMRAN